MKPEPINKEERDSFLYVSSWLRYIGQQCSYKTRYYDSTLNHGDLVVVVKKCRDKNYRWITNGTGIHYKVNHWSLAPLSPIESISIRSGNIPQWGKRYTKI